MFSSSSAFSLSGLSVISSCKGETSSPLLGKSFEHVPGGWRPAASSLKKTNLNASSSVRSLASTSGRASKKQPRGGDQALIQALYFASEIESYQGGSASSPAPTNAYLTVPEASSERIVSRHHRSPMASGRSSIDEGFDPHLDSLAHDEDEGDKKAVLPVKSGHRLSVTDIGKDGPSVPRTGGGLSRRVTKENQRPRSRVEPEEKTEDEGADQNTEMEDTSKQSKDPSAEGGNGKTNGKSTEETEPVHTGYTMQELQKIKDEAYGWIFKQETFAEFAQGFIDFDKDGSKTLSPAELRPLLRSLGYVCTARTIFELLQLAPPKSEDELDFRDFLKMIQVFSITESEQMKAIFAKHDLDNSGTIGGNEIFDLLHDVGYQPTEQEVDELFREFDEDNSGSIDYPEFMLFYESFRNQERHSLRKRAGFTPEEVTEFRESFDHYDKDKGGTLSKAELWKVLDDMDWAPKTKEAQKRLEKIMDEADADGSETYDFQEFLWLMRAFLEVEEQSLFLREKKAIKSCQFSSQEVTEFRNLFESLACAGEIGDITGVGGGLYASTGMSTAQTLTISMSDVKQVLRGAGVALTTQLVNELRSIFEKFAHATIVNMEGKSKRAPQEGKMLDFPEFLLLISHMLKTNFGNLSESANKTICNREKEMKNYEEILQRVRSSVCEPVSVDQLPQSSPTSPKLKPQS